MNLNNLLCPEVISISYALYVIGNTLKKVERIPDKQIPTILSLLGIIFCTIYILTTEKMGSVKMIIFKILMGIVRGICAAGMSVYVNQLIKQNIYK